MMILPVQGHLKNIVTSDQDTLMGDLACECGADEFHIYHNGRTTRGILSAYLVSLNHDFAIKACCARCKRSYLLHCENWKLDDSQRRYEQFSLRGGSADRWKIHICYDWENGSGMLDGYWHCGYESVAADIISEKTSRQKRLFE